VKVTRPAADLSRESVAFRLEQLEQRVAAAGSHAAPMAPQTVEPSPASEAAPPPASPPPEPPSLELEQLQEAWQRTIVPAVEVKSIPVASVLREAHPAQLAADTLTLEFPAGAAFHRQLAEEPKNSSLLREALYEITGRRLALAFAVGESRGTEPEEDHHTPGEDELYELVKETFDARDVEH